MQRKRGQQLVQSLERGLAALEMALTAAFARHTWRRCSESTAVPPIVCSIP